MERFALDLSLEVVEGSTHDLGNLTLWCRLRANTYNPAQPRPQMVAVFRTNEQWSPPRVSEPRVDNAQAARLVETLRALGWPGRELRVAAVETPLAGSQEVRLRVWLNGQEGAAILILQYGGLTGPDADDLRRLLRALVELGELPSQEGWISGTWSPAHTPGV